MSDSLLKPEDNNFDHMFSSVPFSPELDPNQNFCFFLLSGQFFAHTHKDDFCLHIPAADTSAPQQGSAKSFALLAPAISPVYQNNPAFRVMSLDTEQLSLLDYSQYYMDLVMATG